MKNTIDYNFYYWGPLLCKFKLSLDELKKLKKLCVKNKKLDMSTDLAGVVDHEYRINSKDLEDIILPYLQVFSNTVYPRFYGRNLDHKIQCNSAWVNYMKPGDFNPPHIHTGCRFSSVIYTKVPSKLKKEQLQFKGTGAGPGGVHFNYGNHAPDIVQSITHWPEEGDFFIFPNSLIHYVASFKTNVERISIAANFV
jgi:hypothetical protein